MRIKALEIFGFKSFADRARFKFGDGITGVVGPNGCGKSNVVDSIRWCMGEMSAKHLRGRAMQDVIFAGSDSRGPSGMAEVTLVFHTDGDTPPAFAQYAEIAVTRRLYRDGTSEYLINKVPVRLRDVTDLFLGTGVGTRAYSIIEQGRIGFVVNSRPEERRHLIEEVAGITKFKARKKAAERRMEATEQNLKRVQDIVSELDRQLQSLRRQARKAERYKEVREQLRDLDLHVAALDLLRIAVQEKWHAQCHARIDMELGSMSTGLVTQDSRLEADRLMLLESEGQLQRDQALQAELDARLATLERDLEHWRGQVVAARGQVESATLDVDEAKIRLADAQREHRELAEAVANFDTDAGAGQMRVSALEQEVYAQQDRLMELDEELEALRGQVMSHAQGAITGRSRLAAFERQRHDLMARLEAAHAERDELQIRLMQARTRRDALAERAAQNAELLASCLEQTVKNREAFAVVSTRVKEHEADIARRRDHLSHKRSRHASLEAIVKRLDGYSDGVRTLLAGGGGHVPGVLGLVAELIDVPSEHETAIEAVLAERLQYLLVQSPAVGNDAVEYLRAKGGGRGGFVVKEAKATAGMLAAIPSDAGVLGPALEKIQVAPENRAAAVLLLGSVLLVDSSQSALRLLQRGDCRWTLVTPEGTVFEPAGVVRGGVDSGAGLLATRREIRELAEEVAQLDFELAKTRSAHEGLESERVQLELAIAKVSQASHAAELAKIEIRKDAESANADLVRIEQRLLALDSEATRWQETLSALCDDEAATRRQAEQAEACRSEVEERLSEVSERRQIEQARLKSLSEDLTAAKVEIASRHERRSAAEHSLKRLAQTIVELQRRIERDAQVIEEATQAVFDLTERIRDGEMQAKERMNEAQQKRIILSEKRAAYEAERERIAQVERLIRDSRKDAERLQQELMTEKMQLQRLELERTRVVDHVLERHDVDIRKVAGDYHLRPMPDGDAQKQRVELERAIKNMGPINLTAIDECRDVEVRYEFLVGQRDDLVAAIESLKKAIARINRASRDRFREAFESVNEMFQKVYPRLFRGGVARLELVNSEDMLEAGVDIIAQPPGKKLQNVGLLSGGEKALTATALVFSIFLIKPSPFCILDEVDAPLDDANVRRFNEMLREISKFSQFIVISHNKQTMQESDRIYGVTMEEPGMSKVVSVDFTSSGDDAIAAA